MSIRRLVTYFIVRFTPTALVSSIIYVLCLAHANDLSLEAVLTNPNILASDWNAVDEVDFNKMALLAWSRSCSLWFFVIYLCVHSGNFVHRSEGWLTFPPQTKNRPWVYCTVVVVLLQTLFTIIALSFHGRISDFDAFEWPEVD